MELKKRVGYEAAKLVNDGDVVGLGTGSTTHYFIEKLGLRIKNEDIDYIRCSNIISIILSWKRLGYTNNHIRRT